ncbi:MAG: beta-lactamase family protein [Cyanothece sp. SIO1E1]|nr:beta-lactamase family protein [Cyanothece sp. SIO1E1]
MNTTAIDQVFEAWAKPGVPGASLGVIQNGELVFAHGYGLANLEYDIPNDENSVFRIGSTSKQFTAACIVLLSQQGKLNLDTSLSSFFPDFPGYAATITLKHLIHHTSGIRDYLQLAYLKGLSEFDYYADADVLNWLINQTNLNFQPGEEYLYSNSGYWLLGQIVEKASGKNMAEFAKSEIFDPLEMSNTHFHNDHNRIVKNRASGYIPIDEENYRISMTTLDTIGDGGIFTSVSDIKKWDDEFYNRSILNDEFWEIMTTVGRLNNGKKIDYAGGLIIDNYKGQRTIAHGGAFVGFRAELLRFPDQKTTIAIFSNRGDAVPWDMAYQVADIVLKGVLVEDESIEDTSPDQHHTQEEYSLEQLAGDYEIQSGIVIRFSVHSGSLQVLQIWNNASYSISRSGLNEFRIPENDDLTFTFSELSDNLAQTLTIVQAGNTSVANRAEVFDSSGIDLTEFTGSYYSEELSASYHFELVDGNLQLGIASNIPVMACNIVGTDTLFIQVGQATFTRKNGKIKGFKLDSGRVQGMMFRKQ